MTTGTIAQGVWPTMVTPFTGNNEIDYAALEQMIEWYIGHGVAGLFAVCQSSEMFTLSLRERVDLARFVQRQSAGRVQVIASGHISETIEEQIAELNEMAGTGVRAVVLVSNRLAAQDEPDDVWKRNAERLLSSVPDTAFGIYECPYPYKRLMSPELLRWCADTGRFLFLKDTCCDTEQIGRKLEAAGRSRLNLYNANSATLLESVRLGAHGYSGVMANFHPDLYVWLLRHWRDQPEKAEKLQAFLGLSSVIECRHYPVSAKYALALEGIPIKLHTRSIGADRLTYASRREVEQLYAMTGLYREQFIL
ncbi:dihydrodipicolinate synthase family protein [Paenibacillus hamazuiensis]|uniref:dihydrodipicolinate synthase family protein n=1 Tax=Paenibacillus hamazuiensis TaxID=2936508 RepID=UPI00201019E5|nr:dihydrodipicolinate synthase family protein [Paenibacillus hamazuiensis]